MAFKTNIFITDQWWTKLHSLTSFRYLVSYEMHSINKIPALFIYFLLLVDGQEKGGLVESEIRVRDFIK